MTRHPNMNTSLSIFIHLHRVEFSFALGFFFCRQKTKIKRKRVCSEKYFGDLHRNVSVCVRARKKSVQLKMSFGSSTYNTLKVLMTLGARKLLLLLCFISRLGGGCCFSLCVRQLLLFTSRWAPFGCLGYPQGNNRKL